MSLIHCVHFNVNYCCYFNFKSIVISYIEDVEDGESVNPTRSDCTPSPYICVSYHKDIQNKVIVLMQHLTSAGFNCWMETDNRDDGDINSRIREADAVICCATEKFIQSSECNRQVV